MHNVNLAKLIGAISTLHRQVNKDIMTSGLLNSEQI